MLAHPSGTKMGNPRKGPDATEDQPPFRVPPKTAIAGVLIDDWVHRKVVITGPDVQVKGNL